VMPAEVCPPRVVGRAFGSDRPCFDGEGRFREVVER
jgi:hypothetical protein